MEEKSAESSAAVDGSLCRSKESDKKLGSFHGLLSSPGRWGTSRDEGIWKSVSEGCFVGIVGSGSGSVKEKEKRALSDGSWVKLELRQRSRMAKGLPSEGAEVVGKRVSYCDMLCVALRLRGAELKFLVALWFAEGHCAGETRGEKSRYGSTACVMETAVLPRPPNTACHSRDTHSALWLWALGFAALPLYKRAGKNSRNDKLVFQFRFSVIPTLVYTVNKRTSTEKEQRL
jgi:hypothetical protein